jgi:predicted TIM-barrel fold metal-dependent hydrolase
MVNNRMVSTPSRSDEGVWADWWYYEGKPLTPLTKQLAAVGFDKPDMDPTTYDEVAAGCWIQRDRLVDMTRDHVEASLCFPNLVPRFAGQTFLEGEDCDLGLACVVAYNDWILDEWTAGEGRARLLPMTLVPLWDIDAAIAEVERCGEKGTLAVSFPENPYQLGLPSLHTGSWEPFFSACAANGVMVAMHIGSSSKVPESSPDAPHITRTVMNFSVTGASLLDFIFSGILDRLPDLRLFYAESQAGWMPYVLEQADILWAQREGMSIGRDLPRPPSSYLAGRVYTSIFHDPIALKDRNAIGVTQMCLETDYPHAVTTFPNTRQFITQQFAEAGLSRAEIYDLARGNAIRGFHLARVGITR